MFHHPAWAVGSYSSGSPAGGNSPNLSQPNPGLRGHGTPVLILCPNYTYYTNSTYVIFYFAENAPLVIHRQEQPELVRQPLQQLVGRGDGGHGGGGEAEAGEAVGGGRSRSAGAAQPPALLDGNA